MAAVGACMEHVGGKAGIGASRRWFVGREKLLSAMFLLDGQRTELPLQRRRFSFSSLLLWLLDLLSHPHKCTSPVPRTACLGAKRLVRCPCRVQAPGPAPERHLQDSLCSGRLAPFKWHGQEVRVSLVWTESTSATAPAFIRNDREPGGRSVVRRWAGAGRGSEGQSMQARA